MTVLLVSVMGQIEDVARAITLTPRSAGDRVFVLGDTRSELGGSAAERRLGMMDVDGVPETDASLHADRYARFCVERDAGLIRSAHVVARGGLAIVNEADVYCDTKSIARALESLHPEPSLFAGADETTVWALSRWAEST